MLALRWIPALLALALLAGCPAEPEAPSAPQAVDPGPAIAQAQATLEAGDPKAAAIAAWAIVEAHPDRLDARLVLASANVLQGHHTDALTHADAALTLDPSSADAHTNRGAALHGLGRPEDALTATEAALALQSDHQGALRNAARLHTEAERWLAARAALDTLARLRPADAEVRLLLARNRASAGDLPEAQRAIEAAIERAPDNPALHTFAATVLFQRDKLTAAMDRADIALRLDPERRDALLVFEAAFYVRVASTLRCEHGPAPWTAEAITAALSAMAREGLGGVERFHTLHARHGEDPEVTARVARVSRCP